MAAIFEVTEKNYQRYESTDSPSNETLVKLAKFFEVSTDYLLGDTPRKIEFTEPLESYSAWLRKVLYTKAGDRECLYVSYDFVEWNYQKYDFKQALSYWRNFSGDSANGWKQGYQNAMRSFCSLVGWK